MARILLDRQAHLSTSSPLYMPQFAHRTPLIRFWPEFLQDLRRSNFTSADCRNANFKGANLQGTYFIKAVTAKANFEVSVEGASHGPS